MSEANVVIIREMARLESSHDKGRLFALYAVDEVFQDVALELVANGRDEVRRLLDSVYAAMEG